MVPFLGRGEGEEGRNGGAPRQQQRGQRIVDHRLVIDRQKLLGYRQSDGGQACAGAACGDEALSGGGGGGSGEWASGKWGVGSGE